MATMLQPMLVLPSNAPPLRDDEHVYQTSRILQEHSGNRQQNDIGFADDAELKHPSSSCNENSHVGYFHRQPLQGYPPPPLQHRQTWRFGYARGGFRYPGLEDEARIRVDSERLFNRFRKSDAYLKYRNRQTKEDSGNGDQQKWPDHLERAFFRALVQYPPMGRRKQLHKEKQRGRNELIADCIEELTGEKRGRKQVSSHIQVLKPFVENDPYIMKWLAKDETAGPSGRSHASGSSYTSGRRMSNYPITAPPHVARASMPTLPRWEFQRIQKAKGDLTLFQPVDFQMFVQRNCKNADGQEEVQRLHTYTNSISSPLGPDLYLDEMQSLGQDFPLLGLMHAQRPLDCTVLDAEASLAFPVETWKNKDGSPLPGVELGIYFLCMSCHLPATPAVPSARDRGYQIVVHNTFYENGVCAKEQSGPSEARLEASEREGSVETRIKFGSMFWAKTLGRLAGRLLDTNKDHRDEVAAYLKGVNAVQEVVAVSEYGAERLLVIHWKFRHSTAPRGRTSWRRIILPSSSSAANGTAEPATFSEDLVKDERVDSICAYNTQLPDPLTDTPLHHPVPTPAPVPPALQSPFEYESSAGSTLSSATWPTSFGELSMLGHHQTQNQHHHQQHDMDGVSEFPGTEHNDNTFDFTAGNINLSYDPNLDFDTFDSSAFNFDTAAAAADFAADPALAEYSHQWYTGAYGEHFLDGTASSSHHEQQQQGHGQGQGQGQAVSGTENFGLQQHGNELDEHHVQHVFGVEYAGGFHDVDVDAHAWADAHHHVHHGVNHGVVDEHDQHQQAFGGAGVGSGMHDMSLDLDMNMNINGDVGVGLGVNGMMKEGEDALAALADASFLASAMRVSQEEL